MRVDFVKKSREDAEERRKFRSDHPKEAQECDDRARREIAEEWEKHGGVGSMRELTRSRNPREHP